MSVTRDELEKGMYVVELTQLTADGSRVKRKRGRVVEVRRAAARIQFEGEHQPRVARFTNLYLDDEDAAKREARRREKVMAAFNDAFRRAREEMARQ